MTRTDRVLVTSIRKCDTSAQFYQTGQSVVPSAYQGRHALYRVKTLTGVFKTTTHLCEDPKPPSLVFKQTATTH